MFERFNLQALQTRSVSAVALIVGVLLILYFGGWPFILLLSVLAGLALYEWVQLSLKLDAPERYRFMAAGVLYIVGAVACCYNIFETQGFYWAIVFLFMVWGSDSGAYFAGKLIGGPKMAQAISPNKTWAGFSGAILTPALIGFIAMFLFKGIDGVSLMGLMMMSMTGVFIGVAGQGGDLLISAFKRKVGVKDTGTLIPGHGGILDRVDSMLLAAPVYLLLSYIGHS